MSHIAHTSAYQQLVERLNRFSQGAPAAAGKAQDVLDSFRKVRDEIRDFVENFKMD